MYLPPVQLLLLPLLPQLRSGQRGNLEGRRMLWEHSPTQNSAIARKWWCYHGIIHLTHTVPVYRRCGTSPHGRDSHIARILYESVIRRGAYIIYAMYQAFHHRLSKLSDKDFCRFLLPPNSRCDGQSCIPPVIFTTWVFHEGAYFIAFKKIFYFKYFFSF